MKRIVILGLLLGWALLAGAQMGYTQYVKADIPFDFQIDNNTILAKGHYVFGVDITKHLIHIRSSEGVPKTVYVALAAFDNYYHSEQVTVGFVRFEEKYFLTDITLPWVGRSTAAKSKSELNMQKLAQQKVDVSADAVGK